MHYELTAGARRAIEQAARWRIPETPDQLAAPALLLGLLAESECRAALILVHHGIDLAAIRQQWPALEETSDEQLQPPDRWLVEGETLAAAACTADLVASLAAAAQRLQQFVQPLQLATEHLLLGLVAAHHPTAEWLHQHGLEPDRLEADIRGQYGHQAGPLVFEGTSLDPLAFDESAPHDCGDADDPPTPGDENREPESVPPSQRVLMLRVVDAAANRAREGLRVVEDYVRFVLDDRHLTDQFKQLRHDLTAALASISMAERLAARETQADVGTSLSSASEYHRADAASVLAANFARLQESLRSLEEYGKVLDLELAMRCERIRYRTYTLQRAVEYTRGSADRLAHARLYVLVDGDESPEQFRSRMAGLVAAGVHVIQLRDKGLNDRQLVERGRLLRQITRDTGTLFVMNDRPDLAVLCGADGVHIGQEELTVKDARTMVGPGILVGVSTHTLAQARQAVLDGANYIGVGPVFPSETKAFAQFPGLELVRQVAQEIRLPAFAIGGIGVENLPQVIAAGLRRVAVSGAVTRAAEPAAVVQQLLGRLGPMAS
jgi:thiamine-phosphate pyrophosphorylase